MPHALVLAAALQAAAPASPAIPAASGATFQQRFDAASAAATEGRCAEAVAGFDAIADSATIQRNVVARAALLIRRGRCLIGTERGVAAEADIRAALPVLAAKGASFAGDVGEAHQALGRAATLRLDYDAAIREQQAALDVATGVARVDPLIALASLTMFDHDGRAAAFAKEAEALAAPVGKRYLAATETVGARVLLNEGKKREAYDKLRGSLKRQGGLSMRVGIGDIVTRSDLAVAALVNGDREGARTYLAYTGAGRLKQDFGRASDMDLPACGENGLKPEDFAIVEFAISEAGVVTGVTPIYVAGDRSTALAFASSVRQWSWKAEDVAKIPPLFRAATRVEVRCTTGSDRLGTAAILRDAAGWSETALSDGQPWAGRSQAAALPLQRAALAQARDPAARLRIIVAMLGGRVLPDAERRALADEGVALAGRTGTAPAGLLLLRFEQWWAGATTRQYGGENDQVRPWLSQAPFAGDPLSAAALRLSVAEGGRKGPADADALLDAVIAEPGLPERHPFKTKALLLKANLLGARGDAAGAAAAVRRTGLDAEQCSLLGIQPAMKRSGASSADYPVAAYQMGFEGWVRTEFDIAADGRPLRQRAVVAYPPFVFDDAATGIIRDARYASSFAGAEAPVACAANSQFINFRLPD